MAGSAAPLYILGICAGNRSNHGIIRALYHVHRTGGKRNAQGFCFVKHCCNINVLPEILIGAACGGHAIAPFVEFKAICSHRLDGNTGGFAHLEFQLTLVAVLAIGQRAAFFGMIACHIAFHRCRAGIAVFALGGVCTLRNIGFIRALVLGVQCVRFHILEQCIQAGFIKVDIANGEVAAHTKAVIAFQHLAGVQETISILIAHLQQRLVELVNDLHAHIGILCMVGRNGRNGSDDNVAVAVGVFHCLQSAAVALDKFIRFHAAIGVVGAHHHHNAAGLHFRQSIGNGVGRGIALKINAGITGDALNAKAHLAHKLIQTDQTVAVHTNRVGVTNKHRFVQIVVSGIAGFFQNSGIFGIQRILVAVILFADHIVAAGFVDFIVRYNTAVRPTVQQRGTHSDCGQKYHRTACQYHAGLFLQRRKRIQPLHGAKILLSAPRSTITHWNLLPE